MDRSIRCIRHEPFVKSDARRRRGHGHPRRGHGLPGAGRGSIRDAIDEPRGLAIDEPRGGSFPSQRPVRPEARGRGRGRGGAGRRRHGVAPERRLTTVRHLTRGRLCHRERRRERPGDHAAHRRGDPVVDAAATARRVPPADAHIPSTGPAPFRRGGIRDYPPGGGTVQRALRREKEGRVCPAVAAHPRRGIFVPAAAEVGGAAGCGARRGQGRRGGHGRRVRRPRDDGRRLGKWIRG